MGSSFVFGTRRGWLFSLRLPIAGTLLFIRARDVSAFLWIADSDEHDAETDRDNHGESEKYITKHKDGSNFRMCMRKGTTVCEPGMLNLYQFGWRCAGLVAPGKDRDAPYRSRARTPLHLSAPGQLAVLARKIFKWSSKAWKSLSAGSNPAR